MDRSISQGRDGSADPDAANPLAQAPGDRADERARRLIVAIGLGLVLLSLAVYAVSNHERDNFYNHFVWQASAWLEGQAGIRYPVVGTDTSPGNDYFQDVMPVSAPSGTQPGRALIPFPPFPAVILLPFVAVWGLTTNAQLIATLLGALDIGIAFWMLGRLPVRTAVRVATTIFLAFGTVFWYASELGSTWFLAHVVAVGLTLLAIGVALEADPAARLEAADSVADDPDTWTEDEEDAGLRAMLADLVRSRFDRRQVLAGFLLGLAATSRLSVIFGLPFFVLVGGGGSWLRRGASAALGAAVPVAGLLAYNYVSSGHLFHPGYDYQYHLEAIGYPFLHYNPSWSIEDPRYIPQNLAIMLGALPDFLPACPAGAGRELFGTTCPYLVPDQVGMSLLLTSPGWLLGLPALRRYGSDRIVTGAAISIFLIGTLNLMHFSQGWVQFGYRFSNDFAPFALLLVALALQWAYRRRVQLVGGLSRVAALSRVAVALIVVSIAVNAWGVLWANILGW